jgi:cell division protein FtsZ
MIEVSEATSIIQEAAHEEANIIFGAVVDPSMEGRVKITVVATGFGKEDSAGRVSPSAAETPVDLQNYTEWQSDHTVAKTPEQALPVARRSTVSLPVSPDHTSSLGDGEHLELDTSLETPAFLRRQTN